MALQSVQHGKPSLLRLSIQEGNMAKNRKKKGWETLEREKRFLLQDRQSRQYSTFLNSSTFIYLNCRKKQVFILIKYTYWRDRPFFFFFKIPLCLLFHHIFSQKFSFHVILQFVLKIDSPKDIVCILEVQQTQWILNAFSSSKKSALQIFYASFFFFNAFYFYAFLGT